MPSTVKSRRNTATRSGRTEPALTMSFRLRKRPSSRIRNATVPSPIGSGGKGPAHTSRRSSLRGVICAPKLTSASATFTPERAR